MKKPETSWRNNIVDPFLKSLDNCYVMSIQQVSLLGDADKVLCLHGLFVAIELKYGKNKESKIQQWKRGQINEKAGGIAIVASPANWTKVKYFLTELSKGVIHDHKNLV